MPPNCKRRLLPATFRCIAGTLVLGSMLRLGVAVAAGVGASDSIQAVSGAGAQDQAGPRPRIALVLSGGGARGFAHVGVLRALKDMRVPVDVVAGVSMGAVVGGAFAAGRSVEELESFVRNTNWTGVVADRPPRDDLAFRRREDDLIVPSRIELGLGASGIELPPGTAGTAVLETALTRLLPLGTVDRPVDRLPIPFRTAATDLLTGALIDLNDAPLFDAVRASLAVPGVFAPARVRGRLAVDGGLVRNLPVDLARAMGADVVIAVNVGTPLLREEDLAGGLDVARQMLLILTEQNVQHSLKELGPRDVLISPKLEDVSFLDFAASERALAAGEAATRLLAAELSAYAVSEPAYATYQQRRQGGDRGRESGRRLTRLEVQATPHAGSAALTEMLGIHVGDTLTTGEARDAVARLLGRGAFDRVLSELSDDGEGRTLLIRPVESVWARSRVRLGLEVASDFGDDHSFTLTALHTLAWVNRWGAELRTLLRIGSERSIATQLWQPLAPGSSWFVAPTMEVNAASLDVYDKGRRRARLGYKQSVATLALGRQFDNWGSLQVGIDRVVGLARVLVPQDEIYLDRTAETLRFVQLRLDTLDTLAFPSRGVYVEGRYERSDHNTATNAHIDSATLVGLTAFRIGRWDSYISGVGAWSHGSQSAESLGGFLRLSGAPRGSIVGERIVFGSLVMARRIGEMPVGFGGAVRVGFSLETGAGYGADKAMRWSELHRAGSVFVSVDTRFGPLFLGAGATRGIGSALYVFLGPYW
jgi:NTE family protein